MLKELLGDLIAIGQTIPLFSGITERVKEYGNEFDGEEWSAFYPALMIEVLGKRPNVEAADRSNIGGEMYFILYACGKQDANESEGEVHPLTLVDQVYEIFNGYPLEYEGTSYTVSVAGSGMYGRDNTQKVYSIEGYVSK